MSLEKLEAADRAAGRMEGTFLFADKEAARAKCDLCGITVAGVNDMRAARAEGRMEGRRQVCSASYSHSPEPCRWSSDTADGRPRCVNCGQLRSRLPRSLTHGPIDSRDF